MPLATPALEHVADLNVRVGTPIEIGEIPGGVRRVVSIRGGEITGPKLQGKVLADGADYQIIHPDGSVDLDARYVIELPTGEHIYVVNTGIRNGPTEVMERLRRGEPVDPGLVYFRTAPRFETAAPGYKWLMQHIFVASAARFTDHVEISIFSVR